MTERDEEQKKREEKWEEERQAAKKRVEEREAAKKRISASKIDLIESDNQKIKEKTKWSKEAEEIIERRQAAKEREVEALARQKRPDETDDEWKERLNQIFINKVKKYPLSAPCSYPGCEKVEYPALQGSDGKYYCRDHILPENRGEEGKGKPSVDVSIIYRGDTREFRR